MSWSREQCQLLIEEVQKYPCLYAVKSPHYKNKHARQTALEHIQESLQLIKPNVSIGDIKAKFNDSLCRFGLQSIQWQRKLKPLKDVADRDSVLQEFSDDDRFEVEFSHQKETEDVPSTSSCTPSARPKKRRRNIEDCGDLNLMKETSKTLATITETITK
ncbi:hypothetical protein FQR65_LT19081 [Abscondita terminalis]|nr:hypothetical protein FQR65_LT19081 [Abscondita terminalis]